jgi:hypothetical protein
MYKRMASGVPRAKPCTVLVQGKAHGTWLTPKWGDIPAKSWCVHSRPSRRRRDCCRGGGTIQSVHDDGWRLEFLGLVVRLKMKRKGGKR